MSRKEVIKIKKGEGFIVTLCERMDVINMPYCVDTENSEWNNTVSRNFYSYNLAVLYYNRQGEKK